ncbi:hypothetical protein EHS25_003103 [Saitozyma podzolica]|uniref:Methyltransferase domain-containing protein n=1 Tax=Saitozyma podzolica TaxID=1890683 RepID=A0A427Y828_9TREE|nr:hypothetical protein EHS25_003103 [Saitozyma podzolica]
MSWQGYAHDNVDCGHGNGDELVVDAEEFAERTQYSGFDRPEAGLYFVEGGRTYNASVWAYRLPSDVDESIRQDRQHYITLATLPGLYRGPVAEVLSDQSRQRRILDVGCGTGIWLAEMAERFPDVDCVGIDLHHSSHPRNCTYMCVQAPGGMQVFPDHSFDVVHVSQMILSWAEVFVRALLYRGIDIRQWEHVEDILVDAGFDRGAIDAHVYYRHALQNPLYTQQALQEADNIIAFCNASRLMVLESGALDQEGFDEMEAELTADMRGQSQGVAGPEGPRGLLSDWGYWWCIK